ncbi:hypothetical protein CPB84DRAFT_221228 [Gymnopilus junonius]|uniref:Uncharacterized protein n=1 Tax=Gymnopilus junonius TaxID=109634 RepID=A0A9P5THQ1_GYMJU|nr:hypothetical protein CPB84DRAFT_221228 [Gymnopilus junonius]
MSMRGEIRKEQEQRTEIRKTQKIRKNPAAAHARKTFLISYLPRTPLNQQPPPPNLRGTHSPVLEMIGVNESVSSPPSPSSSVVVSAASALLLCVSVRLSLAPRAWILLDKECRCDGEGEVRRSDDMVLLKGGRDMDVGGRRDGGGGGSGSGHWSSQGICFSPNG